MLSALDRSALLRTSLFPSLILSQLRSKGEGGLSGHASSGRLCFNAKECNHTKKSRSDPEGILLRRLNWLRQLAVEQSRALIPMKSFGKGTVLYLVRRTKRGHASVSTSVPHASRMDADPLEVSVTRKSSDKSAY